MLTRTIVVERAGRFATFAQRIARHRIAGQMGAAFKIGNRATDHLEHLLRQRHMTRLSAMRRTGQRQHFVGERKLLDCPRPENRQGLDRLDRRAREDGLVYVTRRDRDAAIGARNRKRAAVNALDFTTARQLSEYGIYLHAGPLRALDSTRREPAKLASEYQGGGE
jgi:hypothetical protein